MADLPSISELWLRNLRILNLDQLDDWPSRISQHTFKNDDVRTRPGRVRRAEWILFRLFELYNPQETKRSLSALFPALEPAQSIRLRAGILTLLASLKQEGLLGTCSLRKSMLDDCHGPRFEHLLLAVSTTVLKMVVVSQKQHHPLSILLATSVDPEDVSVDQLVTLGIAHQYSLSKELRLKQLSRMRTEGLEAYIHIKELTMQAHDDSSNASLAHFQNELEAADVDAKSLKKKVRLAAGADEAWVNVLLSGEPSRDRNPMAEDSFESLWLRTQQGQDFQHHPIPEPGLLLDLETRLGEQQERLKEWQRFQAQVSQRNETLVVSRTPMDSPKKTAVTSARRSPTKSARRAPAARDTPSPTKPAAVATDPRPRRGSQDTSMAVEKASRSLRHVLASKSEDAGADNPLVSSPLKRSISLKQTGSSPSTRTLRRRSKSQLTNLDPPTQSYQNTPQAVEARPQAHYTLLEQEPQTLAERTRESLAFASHPQASGGAAAAAANSSSRRGLTSHEEEESQSPLANDSPLAAKSGPAQHASLAERAQHSMRAVGDSRGRQKSARVRDVAPSLDAADAATLEASGSAMQGGRREDPTTPTNVLLGEAADAESVFKTRTRLRRSPPPG